MVDLIDERGLVLMLHEIHSILGRHGSLLVYSDSKVTVRMVSSFQILLIDTLVHALQLIV